MKTRNKLLKKGMLIQTSERRGIGFVLDEWEVTCDRSECEDPENPQSEYFVNVYWTGNKLISKYWDDEDLLRGIAEIIHEN